MTDQSGNVFPGDRASQWTSGAAGAEADAGAALSPATNSRKDGAAEWPEKAGQAAEGAGHAASDHQPAHGQAGSAGIRVLIMGPQGSGKGTQAARLSSKWGVPAISTGEIFRSNVSEGTELGKTAQAYLDQGALVPDEVTNSMLGERLRREDVANGFILDGYPRNLKQMADLDEFLASQGWQLDAVIELGAQRDELISRIAKRATVEGRSDDNEDAVAKRLEVFQQETAPLLDEYAKRGMLARVDGIGDVAVVTDRILAALADQVG